MDYYDRKNKEDWENREYNNRLSELRNNHFSELIFSIRKFNISDKDYNSFVYDKYFEPKGWEEINENEISLIQYYEIRYFNAIEYYLLYEDELISIFLIKIEDDYYHIEINRNGKIYYYRLDQIKDLKFFIKNLKSFKEKMETIYDEI